MNTTLSTGTIERPNATYRIKGANLMLELSATSNETVTGPVRDTRIYSTVALTAHAKSIAGSLALHVLSDNSTAPSNNAQSSSGATTITINTTDPVRHVFGPLAEFTQVSVTVSTTAGDGSTGMFVDAEFK